ncbi:hypothetical protein GWD52_12615 [Enterobacteriaceae bacterium 4M9]|nr:hypothetical protein [Enterobacteriaceae bacterium 4M9]
MKLTRRNPYDALRWYHRLFTRDSVMMLVILTPIVLMFAGVVTLMRLTRQVYLFDPVLSWLIPATAAGIGGLLAALMVFMGRTQYRSTKDMLQAFGGAACLCFMLSLNTPECYVLMRDGLQTEYAAHWQIVHPGPSRGKSGRCEAGLRINSQSLNRALTLCTTDKEIARLRKPGMNSLLITEKVTSTGVQLLAYRFYASEP